MNDSEQIAKQVIETIYAGSEMQFRCDQSKSVPDFDLRLADGSIAALEVTESVDQTWLQTTIRIDRERYVPAKKCCNSWAVHPRPNADPRIIRAEIDDVLALLEDAGHRQFPISSGIDNSEAVERVYSEMQRLGIDTASVFEPSIPGPVVGILLPSRGGSVSTGLFSKAIEVEANKKDNKLKLAESKAPERHLFVYLTSRNFLPWRLVVCHKPPSDILLMPDEITHIWAAALTDSGCDVVVWTAEKGKHWQTLGSVAISPPVNRS